MPSSKIHQKIGASTVNCALIFALTTPFYNLLGVELWKILTILSFFTYNLCFRNRCLGMRLMQTYIDQPASPLYVLLYTMGFATFFYSVLIPFDLLAVNTLAQIGSLAMTRNTLHANIAGQATLTRDQYLARCKARALLLLLEGKPHSAVASLRNDLAKWPDLQISDWMYDMGQVLASEGDEPGVRLWINGFK